MLSENEEIRQKGTTILMVTHDMGSIIKYCDRVVLLNKGNFVAEGAAGHMVDLYSKKILANQMDSLGRSFRKSMIFPARLRRSLKRLSRILMKDKLTINASRTEYGDGRAEIYDLGLFDQRGNLTNLLLKGELFTIKEKIRFSYRYSVANFYLYPSKIKKERI